MLDTLLDRGIKPPVSAADGVENILLSAAQNSVKKKPYSVSSITGALV